MRTKVTKSLVHIYLVPCILIAGAILTIFLTAYFMGTTRNQDGKMISTNWAREYAQGFASNIEVKNGKVLITQEGIDSLRDNACWLQVIDENGDEVAAVNKSEKITTHYTPFELLMLYQKGVDGNVAIVSEVPESKYTYIVVCPVAVSKATVYIDTQRYQSSRMLIFTCIAGTLLLTFIIGLWYCIYISRQLNQISFLLTKISVRSYEPVQEKGFFGEIYSGLNSLDCKICEAEGLREKNEKAKNEWLTNITHDLKTPLVSMKGYAEMLSDSDKVITDEKAHEYGEIMSRNSVYMEDLIKDLTLTYQLQNGALPRNPKEQDMVRFLRETVIDILNTPEYSKRKLSFDTEFMNLQMEFDEHLLKRAITNLIVNSLVHNSKETEVTVKIAKEDIQEKVVAIQIEDNGKGMSKEELEHLFERYYRGTNTETKVEGTGLGMAIAKQIIEAEGGSIVAFSSLTQGTLFQIHFTLNT